MPNRQLLISDLRKRNRALFRLESSAVRDLRLLYAALRTDMLDTLLTWWDTTGQTSLVRVHSNPTLQRRLDIVMADFERKLSTLAASSVGGARDLGLEAAGAELVIMAKELGVSTFTLRRGLDPLALAMVEDIVASIPSLVQSTRITLTSELQRGLIAGESFPELTRRILQLRLTDRASAFRRGRVSVELFLRRSVIEANNASRQLTFQGAQQLIPGLMKQAIAAVGPNTTETCLRVHGQIQPIDKPYILTGTPRFADKQMYPGFHWNCRTASAAYHPDFEEGSTITTQAMRESAIDEQNRREEEA